MCFSIFKKAEVSEFAKFEDKKVTISLKSSKVYFGTLRVKNNSESITIFDPLYSAWGGVPVAISDIVFIQEGDHTTIEDVTQITDEKEVELNRYKVTLKLKEQNELSFIFDETITPTYPHYRSITACVVNSVDSIISDFLYSGVTKIPDNTHRFVAQGAIISASARLIKGHTRKDKTYTEKIEKVRKLKLCACKTEL